MTYTVFIPLLIVSALMGVGLPTQAQYPADVGTLGATWFYNWSTDFMGVEGFVPMSFYGDDPHLPASYDGYLLVFNEPENGGQTNLTPGAAAARTLALAATYPQARLIVGGTGYSGRAWLSEYVKLLGDYRPAGLHVHGYVEGDISAGAIIEYWTWARSLGIGEFWVTEFAETNGDMAAARRLIDWCRQNSTRYAWFTNRLSGREWYYPQHWRYNPALLDEDGLTDYGRIYLHGIR